MKQVDVRLTFIIPDNTDTATEHMDTLMPLLKEWAEENIPPMGPDIPKPKVTVTVHSYPRKETLT